MQYAGEIDLEAMTAETHHRLQDFAKEQLPKVNVSFVAESGDPARKILEYSQVKYTGVIALPTHGYGAFRRLLMGSVAAKVLNDALVPVWTSAHAPDPDHRAHPQPRHVLCAIDLKPESRRVVDAATALASDAGAKLEILHVAPEGELSFTERERKIGSLLAESAGFTSTPIAKEEHTPPVLTEDASVADVVRETALRHRSDLVVVGRDRRHFTPAGFGSDTYRIIREAPCPVLSV